ncbi:MAG: glycosyltransferase family 9 protein [Candidatus Eremiobacteraeota bacterium]|nr:glycosyltransferase family 9 protein [Candidatus Eremiobacteraeota bacterium]
MLLDYARALGCDTSDATPAFVVEQSAFDERERLLGGAGIRGDYVVLHPTRAIAAARSRWPTGALTQLGKSLAGNGDALIVTGGAADAAIAEHIAREAGGISLAGKTSLGGFGAIAQGARGVVAMDSGPMHLAAAVGAPTVGIYALQSDEPDRWAPLGPRTAVVRPTYPCPPNHRKETCPDFPCVANLDVPRVLAALGGLWARLPEPA